MSSIQIQIQALKLNTDKPLLNDCSYDFDRPGLYILSGSNGSGKSTLLKAIAGLHTLASGQITIKGQSIGQMSVAERAKHIAFAGANPIQEHFITVQDLIQVGRSPFEKHWYDLKPDADFFEIVEHLQIEPVLHKSLNAISDGERQKANIARAIYQKTPVLLLDEPSAFLDYPSKVHLFEWLSQLAIEQSKIIICSTHDLDIANRYSKLHLHISEKKLIFFQQAPM